MAFGISHFGLSLEKLPAGWREEKLGSIAVFNPEQIDRNFVHTSIEYLDISNVGRGTIGQSELLALEDAPSRAKRIVAANDTIISTVRPGNRAYAFLKDVAPNLIVSTGFAVLRAKDADPRFLYYLSTSDPIIDYLASIAEEKTAYPSINPGDIAECRVPIPPISQQRAIAHILGTLDDKIELNRRINETLEAIARALFKSWFVDFDPVRAKAEGRDTGLPKHIADLFPSEFQDSNLGKIPRGWQISTILDEFNLTMGQSPPGHTYNEVGVGIPFFQGRTDFGIRYPSQRVYCTAPTRLANPGDTLVSVRAPVGDINMAMEKCCLGRGVAAIRHKTGSRSYTYYLMRSMTEVFGDFEAEGTVFGCINKGDFQRIKFIAPPPQLVLDFEKMAFPADQTIENQILQSWTLAAIRDTLLPKLLSGEIRISDAEKFIRRHM